MKNSRLYYYKKKSISVGDRVKEFIAWLRGLRSPRYIPQKAKIGPNLRRQGL